MNDSQQIVSGSIYKVSTNQRDLYGFVFLKKNLHGDGFILDNKTPCIGIKSNVNGKIVTCVGKFPVTFSGVTGSREIFLFENRLITALNKDPTKFCSIIE